MKRTKLLLTGCMALVLTGCATSLEYEQPKDYDITNTATVQKPFNQTWKKLLTSLGSEFFVINNIEKDSGIINVSFSSDKPENYIDCGITTRTYSGIQGTEVFTYSTAGSGKYTTYQYPHTIHVKRTSSLEGRMNILLTPQGSSATNVTVNSKYILSIKQRGTLNNGHVITGDFTVDLTSKKPAVIEDEMGGWTCKATGLLEKQVLDFVR